MTGERTGISMGLTDDLDLVRLAEEHGFESVWTGEGQGKTAFGKLERWATATEEIGLATGIVNVFSRSPATLAQAAATLDDHSGGRAILGLGVAHPGVVAGFHGMAFERPLARLAEYVELVRRYLDGVAEPFEGEFFSPDRTSFWDAFEPVRADVPIYNAALGPDNVRLTGAMADGWIPYLYPLERFEEAQDWLREGADRAGRSVDELDIAMYLVVSVADELDEAYAAAAEHVVAYFRDIPGYYDRVAREAGFEDDVRAARTAPTDRAAAEAVSREFVDAVAVVGTEERVNERLAALRRAGLDLPIVRPPMGGGRDAIERTMAALAP